MNRWLLTLFLKWGEKQIADERIQAIYVVRNPDKLAHLGTMN